jgi:hypothetical protein
VASGEWPVDGFSGATKRHATAEAWLVQTGADRGALTAGDAGSDTDGHGIKSQMTG